MWARSHTSWLMIGSTWRSSSAGDRWPTRSSVRRRTCFMASTISAPMRVKPYGGRGEADVNDARPTGTSWQPAPRVSVGLTPPEDASDPHGQPADPLAHSGAYDGSPKRP